MRSVHLAVVFATSKPSLVGVIMVVVTLCALLATHGSMTTRRHTKIDLAQFVWLSQDLNTAERVAASDRGNIIRKNLPN
jgi:hypothetical protein